MAITITIAIAPTITAWLLLLLFFLVTVLFVDHDGYEYHGCHCYPRFSCLDDVKGLENRKLQQKKAKE